MDSGFFLLWFNIDDELQMENAKTHLIVSDAIKVEVTKIESFVSRKLKQDFDVIHDGLTLKQKLGSPYYDYKCTQE